MSYSLGGIYPILPTPFDENECIDLDSFRRVVASQVTRGAHGVVLFGLAGEYYKLSDDERDLLVVTAHEALRGRLPLVVSVTAHATTLALRQAERAATSGAEVLMIMPPFFLNPGKSAILAHIRTVAASVSLPVVVQYSPGQTGVLLEPDDFVQLQEEAPNVVGVKVETVPPGPYIDRLVKRSGEGMACFIGYAGLQMIDALSRGAAGVMPSTAITEVYRAIFDAYTEGDAERARRLHAQMLPLVNVSMQSVEMVIAADKLLLKERGLIDSETCRRPHFVLDDVIRAQLLREYEGLAELLTP